VSHSAIEIEPVSAPLERVPTGSSITNPPGVEFDFRDIDNGSGENRKVFKEGDLTSIDVIRADGRTRLVANLAR
jgi:hypothetical protein